MGYVRERKASLEMQPDYELQWCQLESLQVLFYEVKVPSSDGCNIM